VVADDVLRVIRSIDPGYLGGNCRFMTASATALAYELLKDGNGQYMWRSDGGVNGLTSSSSFGPIAGYAARLSGRAQQRHAGARHLGEAHQLRRSLGLQDPPCPGDSAGAHQRAVRRERAGGFLAFMRADGGLVDAGTNPVKLMQNSAS
jgi:hypothetical protein